MNFKINVIWIVLFSTNSNYTMKREMDTIEWTAQKKYQFDEGCHFSIRFRTIWARKIGHVSVVHWKPINPRTQPQILFIFSEIISNKKTQINFELEQNQSGRSGHSIICHGKIEALDDANNFTLHANPNPSFLNGFKVERNKKLSWFEVCWVNFRKLFEISMKSFAHFSSM